MAFRPMIIISSLEHFSINALCCLFSNMYTVRSSDLHFFRAFGVCNLFTASGKFRVIVQPPSTFCFIRILMFILNPFGHSSNNSALDVSCTGGVAPGGWLVGGGVMSHFASLPGCNSKVADGAASFCFAFSPIKSISSFCPALRFSLYCWFRKQNTVPWLEDTSWAFGICSRAIGFENLRVIFQPPVTLWVMRWLNFILNPLGHCSSSFTCMSSLAPSEAKNNSSRTSFMFQKYETREKERHKLIKNKYSFTRENALA